MQRDLNPCTYIMASGYRGTLYTGVTSNLIQRIHQHRNHTIEGFTKRHSVTRLVYFELSGTMELAIAREKQLKNWRRQWKINLVEATNPNWRDLACDLGFEPLPSGSVGGGS